TKSIGNYAFSGLENLVSAELGSITSMGYCVFSECPSLASITFPKTLTSCYSYSDYRYPLSESNIAIVHFEDGITEIPSYTCAGAPELVTVDMPSTAKTLDNYAFAYCPKLANMDSPRKSFEFFSNTFTSSSALNDSRCTALDTKNSYIQVNSMETLADGTIRFTIKYAINPNIASNARDYTFNLELPDGVNLISDSVRSDDVSITSDNLTSGSFTVSEPQGSVNFSARISELGEYNVSAYLSFYSNGYWNEKIGSVDITCPDITISSAKVVNDFSTDVHGLAQKGENVYIYVNGSRAATLKSNAHTGKYSGKVNLPKASAGTEYEIYAVCQSTESSKVYTLYDTSKPAVKNIVMKYNGTESLDVTDVFMDGASPVISLLSGEPINFSVKTTNSKNVYRMFVTSTKGDEVKYLEAFYNKEKDLWETDGYFDPYNTSYIPGSLNISIFEADVTVMNEKDIKSDDLAVENVPQEVLDNSSYDVLYEDNSKQLVEINLSDGKESFDYKMLTGESDNMYINGMEVSKYEIAKNPKKYNATRIPYETVDGSGRTSVFYEIGQQSTDAILQYESMMNNVVGGIAAIAGSECPAGTAILQVVEGENSDNLECILINNVVSNADTIYDIVRGAGQTVDFGFGAGEVFAIAGDTANLAYRLSLPGADSDVTRAAVACWACKVGVTILGSILAASAGPVGWAIAFAAGVAIETQDSWLWRDFGKTQQFDPTSNKFMRFVVDPSGIVYNKNIDNVVQGAKITVYSVDKSTGKRELWNAEDYEQKNPMYTDKNGYYACDVPEGDWLVVCSYAGYSDIESEIFSVPPEKTDLNFDLSEYRMETKIKGDANMDGKVSISDAVAILQYIANNKKFGLSEQAKINADVDGVAGVTGNDAAVIQQYDAGLITSF
ncbi:MAG: leucine-rich repeat protein, partial [Ruminococcus sp.]|nr:leucine-rich repeat protein [Ruminococcus sp.]